ncbi:hypothetical protein ACQP1W_44240 [Spirillospora sp. CA-255316]
MLVATAYGIGLLGVSGCDGDDPVTAKPPAPSAPSRSPTGQTGATGPAPAASSPTPPSPGASLPDRFTSEPAVTGSQVVMIDPDGKKYTRKEMVQMAAGMAAAFENGGLPSDFCSMSYSQGVKEGGKFPAGRAAFIEACLEGVRLAG